MKKIMLFMMAIALTGQTMAAPINDDEQPEQFMQEEIVPVTVTYLDNVYSNGGWDANWFITVQGGMSAFLGKPVGHGDLFDRTKPVFIGSASTISRGKLTQGDRVPSQLMQKLLRHVILGEHGEKTVPPAPRAEDRSSGAFCAWSRGL